MRPLLALAAPLLFAILAACSSSGGGALHPGLTQRMDAAGATLDRAQAIGLINNYRATVGAPALVSDPSLDSAAATLAQSYASTGRQPAKPEGAVSVSSSAGYQTFAETFSGWRNSSADAAVLTQRAAKRAGIATVYSANSGYGVYWVLLLDD